LKVKVEKGEDIGKPTYVVSVAPSLIEKQQEIKNSPNFYQEAPFLTIAEDLLKLIKEDKVEDLTFLSAYDKKKFPTGDPRKRGIFNDTFGKVSMKLGSLQLKLIGFDSEILERADFHETLDNKTKGQ